MKTISFMDNKEGLAINHLSDFLRINPKIKIVSSMQSESCIKSTKERKAGHGDYIYFYSHLNKTTITLIYTID